MYYSVTDDTHTAGHNVGNIGQVCGGNDDNDYVGGRAW